MTESVRYNRDVTQGMRAGVAQLVERVIGNDEVHGSDSHHQLQTKRSSVRMAFLFGFLGGSRRADQETFLWKVFPPRGVKDRRRAVRSTSGKGIERRLPSPAPTKTPLLSTMIKVGFYRTFRKIGENKQNTDRSEPRNDQDGRTEAIFVSGTAKSHSPSIERRRVTAYNEYGVFYTCAAFFEI